MHDEHNSFSFRHFNSAGCAMKNMDSYLAYTVDACLDFGEAMVKVTCDQSERETNFCMHL